MQHGIFHYGWENIHDLEAFKEAKENAPRLSRRPKKMGPMRDVPSDEMLEYGKFGEEKAGVALDDYAKGLNVHHGRGYKPDKVIYEEMRKAIFLEKELFGKDNFSSVPEMTDPEFKSLQSKFNRKFGLFVIKGEKFADILNHFEDRR